ncbi:MAG: hypothetical protein LC790_12780 [Actinobacteria bacterium]|nr:hypothetical protein [Actinomycetota bacterium]
MSKPAIVIASTRPGPLTGRAFATAPKRVQSWESIATGYAPRWRRPPVARALSRLPAGA